MIILLAQNVGLDWTEIVNFGVPMVILSFVGIACWRIVKYVGLKLFDPQNGVVERWVTGEQAWRTKLTERMEQQQDLCETHATSLQTLSEILNEQKEISKGVATTQQMTGENLAHLASAYDARGALIQQAATESKAANDGIGRMRRAGTKACEMCRTLARKGWPEAADEVAQHVDEIERIIGEV